LNGSTLSEIKGLTVKPHLSRKAVIAATALVMLGGAAGAVAATQSTAGTPEQAYINDLANRLNVTPSALEAAITAAGSDQIDAAVKAGTLTQAEADALKARIQQGNGVPFLGGRFGGDFGRLGGGFGGGLRAGDTAAATYLGITEATLRADLVAGKTLSQVADATPGKSSAGLKDALVTAETTRLKAALAGGEITSQDEQARLADLPARIDALLARTFPADGPGKGWRGHGGLWAGGPPPVGASDSYGSFSS
jgi:hypothetical protein